MPYVDIGEGVQLHYEETNPEGEVTLLFCHGSGGNSRHWRYQEQMPGNIRLLAVDLPGHGESSGSPQKTVADYREALKSMVDALQLKNFFLSGHSLGGAITLDYARCYPEGLEGMVLVATGARLRVMPSILETFRQEQVFPDMPYFIYGDNADPKLLEESQREMEETPPSVFYADFTACDNFDIIEETSSINVPALIIVGSEDRLTPPKYSQFLADNLPNAELLYIEGAGHMVMLEAYQQVNEKIVSWIEGLK